MRKYGSQGRLEGAIRRFFAWEDRYEVDAKFDATINALHALADQVRIYFQPCSTLPALQPPSAYEFTRSPSLPASTCCTPPQTWELIPNENRIKRSTRDPRAAVALRNGHAFALHRLRNANQFSVRVRGYLRMCHSMGREGSRG